MASATSATIAAVLAARARRALALRLFHLADHHDHGTTLLL
jgi:hypothetical protein